MPGAILDIEPITQQPYDMACVPTSLLMISNYYFPEDGYTLENMRQMLNKTLQYDVFRYGVFHDDHEKITRSTPFQCTLNSTYIIGEMVSFTDSDIVVSELKNSNPLMGIDLLGERKFSCCSNLWLYNSKFRNRYIVQRSLGWNPSIIFLTITSLSKMDLMEMEHWVLILLHLNRRAFMTCNKSSCSRL